MPLRWVSRLKTICVAPLQRGPTIYAVLRYLVNTFLAGPDCPILNPPKLDTALYFLAIFTNLENEFNRIDLVNTGLFDLNHPDTAQQLDIAGALRAIRHKSQLAKTVVRWVDDNQYQFDCDELETTLSLTN